MAKERFKKNKKKFDSAISLLCMKEQRENWEKKASQDNYSATTEWIRQTLDKKANE